MFPNSSQSLPFASRPLSPGALRLARWLKIALIAVCAYFCARHLIVECLRHIPVDFLPYYSAAHRLRAGANPYMIPGAPAEAFDYLYPLFFMVLMVPLSFAPLKAAEIIWWLMNIGLLASGAAAARAFVCRAAHAAHGGHSPSGLWPRLGIAPYAAVAVVLTSLPVMITIRHGQANLLVIMAIVASLYLCARGWRRWGGAAFALAILLKAQPILLLPAMLPALGWSGLITTTAIGACYVLFLAVTGLWRWEWQLWTVKAPHAAAQSDFTFALFRVFERMGAERPLALALAATAEAFIVLIMIAGVVRMWQRRTPAPWIAGWGIACWLPLTQMLEYPHLVALCVPWTLLLAAGQPPMGGGAGTRLKAGRRIVSDRLAEPLICAALSFVAVNLGRILSDYNARLALAASLLYYAGMAICAWGVLRHGIGYVKPDEGASGE